MKVSDAASLIRFYTNTDTTTFSDANVLLLMNMVAERFAVDVANLKGSRFFQIVETQNLVADQRRYDYTATNVLKPKYIEMLVDATNAKWVKLKTLDLNVYNSTTDETTIVSQFANEEGQAFYEIIHNDIYIYSGTIINTTNGLKMRLITKPAVFTNLAVTDDMSVNASATSFGLPTELHEVLCRLVGMIWKSNRDVSIPLNEYEKKWDLDYQWALNSLSNYDAGEEANINDTPRAADHYHWGEDL